MLRVLHQSNELQPTQTARVTHIAPPSIALLVDLQGAASAGPGHRELLPLEDEAISAVQSAY